MSKRKADPEEPFKILKNRIFKKPAEKAKKTK